MDDPLVADASAGAPSTLAEIRAGSYYDSVVLMQLQRALAALPGVLDAGVVMGTPANKELLVQNALLTEEVEGAAPEDLILIVRRSRAGGREPGARRRSSVTGGHSIRILSLRACQARRAESRAEWFHCFLARQVCRRVAAFATQPGEKRSSSTATMSVLQARH